MRIFLFVLLSLTSLWVHAQDGLLAPEEAFRFSAGLVDPANVEARFQIADGYYLYRNKIKFSADSGVQLGQAAMPPGKVKEDEFFGKLEIYRGDLRIRIPILGAVVTKPFKLTATYQGCADIGVCYPPQQAVVEIQPGLRPGSPSPAAANPEPAPATSAIPVQNSNLIARLKQLAGALTGGGGEPKFLPPDEAFQLDLEPAGGNAVHAHFTIANQYYLYRDKIHFTVNKPAGVSVEGLSLPTADVKQDPNFGTLHVYHHSFDANFHLTGLTAGPNQVSIAANYQGCSEKGVCYPPIEKTYTLNFTGAQTTAVPAQTVAPAGGTAPAQSPAPIQTAEPAPSTAPPQTPEQANPATPSQSAAPSQSTAPAQAETPPATATPEAQPPTAAPSQAVSETGKITAILRGGNFWVVVASFFGFGLLLSLTPCVFPMIPILSGIIVGQGKGITKRRGFVLSLFYVLGMALTYAIAGVFAGLSGTLISNTLQNPWALGFGAAIFLALAFSMFGFYELQLPSFLQSRFTEASNRLKGGNLVGVFIMGVLSALIVGPCVAAPLAGALLYIGQSGDLVLGAVSLFTLALGMGVPLLLVGISAGALLPRAGGWMDAVKKFFGVLMVAVAIWLVSPLIADSLQMLLWAALLILSGVYLRALEPLAVNAGGWVRFWKGMGIISLVVGIAVLLGALGGSRDVLQPLSVYQGGAGRPSEVKRLAFQRVSNIAELKQAVHSAKGRYVMLDFYADWCTSCKEMERATFSDPRVQQRLADVVALQVDVTNNTADDRALLKRFDLFGPPGIIFFGKDGRDIPYRVVGYEAPERFLKSLSQAIP
jgi:thiol:disulfide interchange protein DsbD